MVYRYVATSVAGFIQQLAVAYVTHGYYFYVTGAIPEHKDPFKTDEKLIKQYGVGVSKWTRSRRKKDGQANVHYLRHERFYILIASHGDNPFFAAESKRLKDVRKWPVQFMGYSIGCRRERGGGQYHASVRIDRDRFRDLKAEFQRVALERSVEELTADFLTLPFEPYAPVRDQLGVLVRAVNERRKLAGLEPISFQAVRIRRATVLPFA